MKALIVLATFTWVGLWFTPDQVGQRLFRRGEFAQAAQAFEDPLWQGVAWYRAGEFAQAVRCFARSDDAEAHYNQGNAWLLQGKYETAAASYDRALNRRPDWQEAAENRALALARAEQIKRTGGNQGGEQGEKESAADKTVFDKDAQNQGEAAEIAGGEELSGAQIQALWLRRVQTRPADFLRSKFAYQLAQQESAE